MKCLTIFLMFFVALAMTGKIKYKIFILIKVKNKPLVQVKFQ